MSHIGNALEPGEEAAISVSGGKEERKEDFEMEEGEAWDILCPKTQGCDRREEKSRPTVQIKKEVPGQAKDLGL